jgi:hypothetical protein
MTDIVRHQSPTPGLITDREIATLFEVARALAASGMFKDARQAEQAFAKVLIGRDLGLSPTEAMMGLHIVEGKPELSAALQAAFVKRTPGYDYRVLEHTTDACEIAFYRDGDELGRSRFTMEDARTAGLAGRGPWKSYPKNMLFARAMSNGVAFHCPEVTGGVRVYSEGEISGQESPAQVAEPVSARPVTLNVETGEVVERGRPPVVEPEVIDRIDEGRLEALTDIAKRAKNAGVKPGRIVMAMLSFGLPERPSTLTDGIANLTAEQADQMEAWLEEATEAALDAAEAAGAADALAEASAT